MMTSNILIAIGGVGLFLLGMIILTDGLKELAGNSLRRFLVRFTRTPTRGAVAGALTTAVIQSSSATTVTAVGFVSAGLLTFPQSVGIIFGANIGTTITGWMVAVIGFKLELGLMAMLLLPVGVLMRFFGSRKVRQFGWVLAGFSVLFLGIETMQQGLASFEGVLTPKVFPQDTWLGRLQLIGIGILITLVTQSSSAGVATALVALNAGAISLPQAAALVIGMDIGTTFTAALATIGGATETRRTGYAHVVYNLLTGTFAFLMLGPYLALAAIWMVPGQSGNAELTLVAFHTLFNLAGVLLALPFAGPFARLMTQLVPDRGPQVLQRLDSNLLRDPPAAIDASAASARDIALQLVSVVTRQLQPSQNHTVGPYTLRTLAQSIEATRHYLEQAQSTHNSGETHGRHLATLHALDHLARLVHRCSQTDLIERLQDERRLRRLSSIICQACEAWLGDSDTKVHADRFDRLHTLLRAQRQRYRITTIHESAHREIDADTALWRMDGIRWLYRVTYHLWRIIYHLDAATQSDTKPDPATFSGPAPGGPK